MMINYLGSPGRLTLHDDLNYGRKTKLPDAGRALDKRRKTYSKRAKPRVKLAPRITRLYPISLRSDDRGNYDSLLTITRTLLRHEERTASSRVIAHCAIWRLTFAVIIYHPPDNPNASRLVSSSVTLRGRRT